MTKSGPKLKSAEKEKIYYHNNNENSPSASSSPLTSQDHSLMEKVSIDPVPSMPFATSFHIEGAVGELEFEETGVGNETISRELERED